MPSSGSTALCLLHLESHVTVMQPQAEEQSDYETNSAIRLSVQREWASDIMSMLCCDWSVCLSKCCDWPVPKADPHYTDNWTAKGYSDFRELQASAVLEHVLHKSPVFESSGSDNSVQIPRSRTPKVPNETTRNAQKLWTIVWITSDTKRQRCTFCYSWGVLLLFPNIRFSANRHI